MSANPKYIHPSIHFERRLPRRRPKVLIEEPSRDPFPFDKLPISIQGKILAMLLHFDGELVHAISRLDPFVEPKIVLKKAKLEGRCCLLNRFFLTSSSKYTSFNLTHGTQKPNELLSVLFVSKRWLFLGIHAFYGLNTFAFSSLGEFGRFARGIGTRRLQYASSVTRGYLFFF